MNTPHPDTKGGALPGDMSAKLTPWLPKNVRPVRVGYYERDWDGDGNLWNLKPDYWDGTNWRAAKGGDRFLHGGDQLPWRGLASDPGARALPQGATA